jgi:hypothetical protein
MMISVLFHCILLPSFQHCIIILKLDISYMFGDHCDKQYSCLSCVVFQFSWDVGVILCLLISAVPRLESNTGHPDKNKSNAENIHLLPNIFATPGLPDFSRHSPPGTVSYWFCSVCPQNIGPMEVRLRSLSVSSGI